MKNTYEMELVFKAIAVLMLFFAAIFDLKNKKIPITIPFVQMILSFCYWICQLTIGNGEIKELFLSFVPGILLVAICFISRQGVGMGDGLMVLSLGPLMGMTDILLAVLIGFTLSAIVGAVLLILKKVNGKSTLAFIPFLTAGVGVMCFAFT